MTSFLTRQARCLAVVPIAATLLLSGCGSGSGVVSSVSAPTSRVIFIRSASENPSQTQVSLPLYQGVSNGQTVWYIITDSSDQSDALSRGVNFAPKLANVANTSLVQQVTVSDGGKINFPATVDFGPKRILVPGNPAFPPAQAVPGATGLSGYSPLIQLPNGVVLNASQVANASGVSDKVARLDTAGGRVIFRETTGFFAGRVVHYISTDASAAIPATLEDVTLVPTLNDAPSLGDESGASARETIVAFTNGQTGASNPQRQGLTSAIVDGLNPLNIVDAIPPGPGEQGPTGYSPLWDVNLATWTTAAVNSGQNVRLTAVGTVRSLAIHGLITAPGGGTFGATGAVVDCPIISVEP